jgi:hypothetical protein
MSDVFCPEGFIPVDAAIVKAAHCWFAESLEKTVPQLAISDGNIDAAVQALWQLNRAEWPWDAIEQTVTRLRNYLHQGAIKACYFPQNRPCQSIKQYFWATAKAADGALESNLYSPHENANRKQLHYRLFFKQSEFDALLNKQPKSLPRGKIPQIVEALRKMPGLTRPEQHEALKKIFRITHRDFWEAARQLPREVGRRATNRDKQES